MSDGECSVKAVVLDDGAASLGRADCADVRHAQGVARVVATKILNKGSDAHLNHCLEGKIAASSRAIKIIKVIYETSHSKPFHLFQSTFGSQKAFTLISVFKES